MTLWTFVTGEPIFGVITFLIMLLALYGAFSIALGLYCRFRLKMDKEYQPKNWISYIVEDKQGHSIILFLLAIMLFAYFVIFVFANYWGQGILSDEIGDWGAVGDYFGGLLNPILAFASFMALLYTIRIQSEELRLTREELTKSAKAQEGSSEALKKQVANIEKQSFEDTFFKMLDRLNELAKSTNLDQFDVEAIVRSVFVIGEIEIDGEYQTDTKESWLRAIERLKIHYSPIEQMAGYAEIMLRFVYSQRPTHGTEVGTSLQEYYGFYIELITTTINKNNLNALVLWCGHNEDCVKLRQFIEIANLFSTLKIDYDSNFFKNDNFKISESGFSKHAFSKDV